MKFVVLFLILIPFLSNSQVIEMETEELRKMEFSGVYKSSISIELAGKTGFGGVSYDLLLTRKLRLGIGAGYTGAGIDLKFYPQGVKREKVLLNIGLRANAFFQNNGAHYMFYSLPIGITSFTVNRINLEFDAGPMWKRELGDSLGIDSQIGAKINYVWFSAKIGYRFSFYAIKRARKLNKEESLP